MVWISQSVPAIFFHRFGSGPSAVDTDEFVQEHLCGKSFEQGADHNIQWHLLIVISKLQCTSVLDETCLLLNPKSQVYQCSPRSIL